MRLADYLSDAISRAESGLVVSPSGSWLAGMFGKASSLLETDFRSFVSDVLSACDLTYPSDFIRVIPNAKSYEKLTLGQLIAVCREAGKRNPGIVGERTPCGWSLVRFLKEIENINSSWRQTKHGKELRGEILLERMKAMLILAKHLENAS